MPTRSAQARAKKAGRTYGAQQAKKSEVRRLKCVQATHKTVEVHGAVGKPSDCATRKKEELDVPAALVQEPSAAKVLNAETHKVLHLLASRRVSNRELRQRHDAIDGSLGELGVVRAVEELVETQDQGCAERKSSTL